MTLVCPEVARTDALDGSASETSRPSTVKRLGCIHADVLAWAIPYRFESRFGSLGLTSDTGEGAFSQKTVDTLTAHMLDRDRCKHIF